MFAHEPRDIVCTPSPDAHLLVLAADPQTRVTMVRHLSRAIRQGESAHPQFNDVLGVVREEKSECHKDINEVG